MTVPQILSSFKISSIRLLALQCCKTHQPHKSDSVLTTSQSTSSTSNKSSHQAEIQFF